MDSRHHDFTRRGWGHSLETLAPYRFMTFSRPRVQPGDTVSYETQDHRVVTYRVLEDGYSNPYDPGDQVFFNGAKVDERPAAN